MLPNDAQSLLCRWTISDLVTIDLIAVSCIPEVSAQLIVTLGASCTVALLWPCQPLLCLWDCCCIWVELAQQDMESQ